MLLKLSDYYYDNNLGFHFHLGRYIKLLDRLDFSILKTIENSIEYGQYLKDKDKYREFKFLNVFTYELKMSMKGLSKKYPNFYYVFFNFGFEIGYNPGLGDLEEDENPDEYDKYNFNLSIIQDEEF